MSKAASKPRPEGIRRLLLLGAVALLAAVPLAAQKSPGKPAARKAPTEKQQAEIAVAAAQQALERKDYATAVTLLESFLLEHPGHAEALFELAYTYTLQGRTADAIEMYRETLTVDPKLLPARVNLGLLLLESGKPEAAVAEFQQAIELEPNQSRTHFYLAAALERSGQKDGALPHYRRAAELEPRQAEPRRALLGLLLEKSDSAGAEVVLAELLALEPTDVKLLQLRGDLLLQQEKPEEALAAYEEYLKAKPEDAGVHLALGRLHRGRGRTEEALQHFLAAEAGTPSEEAQQALEERADTLAALERWTEAVPLYRQAAERHPADAERRAALGYALLQTRNFQEAVPQLTEALRLAPERVETYNLLASVLYLAGDLAGAIGVLDRRAAQAPETEGTLFLRAISHDKLKQCGLAIDYYEKFLALGPDRQSDPYFQATGRLRLLKNVCRERRR